MARDERPVIRASELGEYDFCARAWWQRRALGWSSRHRERLERGEQAHAAHGRAVAGSGRLMFFGLLLLLAGLALAVLG